MTLSVDVHVLQTVPPANLNRDDSGRPKTAVYGGVRRARVSSQAWKKCVRDDFSRRLDPQQIGVRTLRAHKLLTDLIRTRTGDAIDASAAAKTALENINLNMDSKRAKKNEDEDAVSKTEYLVFFSNQQLEGLAELAAAGETDKKAYKEIMQGHNGIDLALFGRMVANDAELNVDASVQVAHAISTHAVENEFDFYTAVDDKAPEDETGAGMMGTIEFNSSVLYRFATINVDLLDDQLADHADTTRAVQEFVSSFITSMPTGKQNTFANRTLPDAAVITIRPDRGVSFVSAFETPVKAGPSGGFLQPSVEAMTRYAAEVEQFAAAPSQTWVIRIGENTASLDQLGAGRTTLQECTTALGESIAEALARA